MRWVAPIAAAHLLWAGTAVCGSGLVPGTASQFELAVGGVEGHPLMLDAGAFVHVELRELGPRVVLALLDPAGAVVARREASGQQVTSYRLLAVAPASGNYTLEVRASGQDGPGRHELRLEVPRAATDMDLRQAAADAALAEAARLASEGSPESRGQALAKLDAAETGFRDADDRRGVAFAVRDRGIVQFALGDPAAGASFEQALGLFRALGDRSGEAVALNGLAEVRNLAGERGTARALFEQAAAISEAAGDPRATANYLTSVGLVLDHIGSSEKALEFHLRGLAMAAAAGSRRAEARAYINMGVGYQNLGEQRKALECYERGLALMHAAGSRLGEVVALGNVSNAHHALGNDDQALAFFEKALPLSQAWAFPAEEAYLLKNVTKVYRALGDHARAIEAGRRAVDLSRQSGDREGEGEALQMLGRALHAGGDNEAALEQLRQALTVVTAIGERYGEAETLLALAHVERDRGHLREAVGYAEACIALTEDLRGAMTNPELRGSFQAAEEDKYGVYIDLLMRMHEQQPAGGHDAVALQVSERARGRLLLEALIEARADIRQGVDADLLDRERALQKQLSESAARLTELPAGSGPNDPARREFDALTEEYGQLQSRIRARSPGYAALTQPVPATLEAIRRDVLDEDTMLLEFYLGEKRSFLWAVTPKDLVSQPLPPRLEIETAARKVHELETARQRSRLPADTLDAEKRLATESVALSRLVLGGIGPRLGADWKKKRLLIVASGALAYLPFGALPTPGDTSRALLRDHEIVYAPSASVLVALRQEHAGPSPSAKRVGILADPVFDASDPRVHGRVGVVKAALPTGLRRAAESFGRAGFTRLPFSRQEAEGIASFVGRGGLVKATDFQARRSLVTEGGVADRQILHFATHGLLDSEHPDLSGLVLSLVDETGSPQDGFLRMQEVYNLRLPADLVVLSACQTALGREIRGEGLVGLTRGFMYAGARRVVASLWQVDDESTAELMKRFYRAMLKEGRRPADALRTAQLEMSGQPRWQAPFYWAGFVLQGEWR